MRDVVVTGIGTLGVSGAGFAAFGKGLASGELPLTELGPTLETVCLRDTLTT